MNRNVRKILISIILMLTLVGVVGVDVYGKQGGSNGIGDTAGTGNSCKDCSCKYVDDDANHHIWGTRISLIDNQGNRIPGTSSIDVFSSASPATNNGYEKNGVYVVSG